MSDSPVKFLPADPAATPPDGELADAMATLLIGARWREPEQAGDGETVTETELEPAK